MLCMAAYVHAAGQSNNHINTEYISKWGFDMPLTFKTSPSGIKCHNFSISYQVFDHQMFILGNV